MRKTDTEMQLINKFYDLVIWTSNHVAKFPRPHKFTLGDRMQSRLYEVLETLIAAKYRRERLPLLQDANLQLEMLRFQFRIAKDLRCLSVESYGYAARTMNEIGRLLGGWIKTAGARGPALVSRRRSVHAQPAAARLAHRQPDQPVLRQRVLESLRSFRERGVTRPCLYPLRR